MMTAPAKSSKYTWSKMATHRLHWSDTSLHLFAVGNSELMLEVWLNTDATHFVIRYCLSLCVFNTCHFIHVN